MTTRGISERTRPSASLALLASGGLALAACGGGGGDADSPSAGAAWREDFPSFTRHTIAEVGLGSLGPDERRFVATIEPWHGNEVVVYTPKDGGAFRWSREVIETELDGGHGLVAADLDGDGYDEIVAGHRGGDYGLYIYRHQPDSESWGRIPVDVGGIAVSSLDVEDINGDGRLDILSVGSATSNVVWYENAGIQ